MGVDVYTCSFFLKKQIQFPPYWLSIIHTHVHAHVHTHVPSNAQEQEFICSLNLE